MKKIIAVKIEGNPYCTQVYDVLYKLKAEFPAIEIDIIDEKLQPERAKVFEEKYRYLPAMFIDGKKVYESHPGESYEECFSKVQKVFQSAVQ